MVKEPHATPLDQEDAGGSIPPDASVAVEMERLQQDLADAKDRLLRVQAEAENIRKRMRREVEEELRYANLPLLRDLLPVVDNMTRAVEAAEKNPEAPGLLAGVKMLAQQLAGVLERHDCQPIAAVEQPFDPNVHEAVMQQPSANHPPGTVLAVLQAGFKLHDRVIRPSQVVVSREPASGEEGA